LDNGAVIEESDYDGIAVLRQALEFLDRETQSG
jgi:hypothetical protein